MSNDTTEETHDHVVPGSDNEPDTADVAGYDFRVEFDVEDLLDALRVMVRLKAVRRAATGKDLGME